MRTTNQIIIFLIFIAIIFVIKNDYKNIYSNTVSYLQNEADKTSDLRGKVDGLINAINPKNEKSLTAVETPGALVVPNDLLTYNTKNIKLTVKGVIDNTNKQRALNGSLPALKENSKLNFSAEKKLQDMFVKQYFEHNSPEGVGVGDLGIQSGYEYIIIGENLALGNFKDDASLVDAWMNSPGHRANILNKKYTEIGVAVAKGEYKGDSVWIGVQHFALPKSACPTIDGVLKGIIDLDQKTVGSMEGELASRKAKIDSGAVYEGMTTSEQIDIYNRLVNEYNNFIKNLKEKIDRYNREVRDFNSCIAQAN